MLAPETLERELQAMQAAGLPCNVNFFAHRPPDAAQVDAAEDPLAPGAGAAARRVRPGRERRPTPASRQPFDVAMAEVLERCPPAVVSFHFGLPDAALLARCARWVVASWRRRRRCARRSGCGPGVDAVTPRAWRPAATAAIFSTPIPTGRAGMLALVAACAQAPEVPVIAAGGIGTAAEVREALAAWRGAGRYRLPVLRRGHDWPLHCARLLDLQAPTALTNLFSGGSGPGGLQ